MEEAAVMMVGMNSERIVQRLVLLEREHRGERKTSTEVFCLAKPQFGAYGTNEFFLLPNVF
jgi:hypothetical protein